MGGSLIPWRGCTHHGGFFDSMAIHDRIMGIFYSMLAEDRSILARIFLFYDGHGERTRPRDFLSTSWSLPHIYNTVTHVSWNFLFYDNRCIRSRRGKVFFPSLTRRECTRNSRGDFIFYCDRREQEFLVPTITWTHAPRRYSTARRYTIGFLRILYTWRMHREIFSSMIIRSHRGKILFFTSNAWKGRTMIVPCIFSRSMRKKKFFFLSSTKISRVQVSSSIRTLIFGFLSHLFLLLFPLFW